MSLFFYLLTFAINLWHRKFTSAVVTAAQSTWYSATRTKIFIKSLYLQGNIAKRLTDELPEKSWTKRAVNRLLKKLQEKGTVDRRPDSFRCTSQCPVVVS